VLPSQSAIRFYIDFTDCVLEVTLVPNIDDLRKANVDKECPECAKHRKHVRLVRTGEVVECPECHYILARR